MTHFVPRIPRAALACAALMTALLLPGVSSASPQQVAQQLAAQKTAQRAPRLADRQIAANDSPAGTLTPGASLGAPGATLGGPGAGMAPQGEDAAAAPAAGAPGAALAPKEGAAMREGMGSEPSQAEINEKLLYEHLPPTRVRIAIVNATGKPDGAAKVAVLLSEYRRRPLEDKMGLKIDLVNISTGYDRTQAPAVVYYRPGFLRAALLLAQAIPGDTMVSAMRPQALKRAGMDVEVVVGEALP